MLKNISVNKLDVNNNIIIDIRDKEKYNTSHIPNSVHIENDKLIVEIGT